MPVHLLRKLRAVQLRIQMIEFSRKTLLVIGGASALLAVAVLASRLFSFEAIFGRGFDLMAALPWVGGVSAVVLLGWVVARRIRLFDAAVRADEALGLRERLSSAVLIGKAGSEPEAAVIEDATRWAQNIRPAKAFRFELWREFKMAATPLALLIAFSFLPHFNLFAGETEDAAAAEKKAIAIVSKKKEAAKKLEALAEEMKKANMADRPMVARELDRDIQKIASELNMQKISIEKAMADMSKMESRLGERRTEIEKRMARASSLQDKGRGRMTSELAKAVKQGNFGKAARLMDELKKKLQNGELSDKQKSQLQKEMKALAGELGDDDPIGQALSKASDSLSQNMMNAALGEMDMAMDGLMEMGEMLAELAMLDSLQKDMQGRKRAMSGQPGVCQSCGAPGQGTGQCAACGAMNTSPWAPGETNQFGNGMGGPGIGRGGVAQSSPHDVQFQKSKIQGQMTAGKIIGRMKVPGDQIKGEISTEYGELIFEAAQQAEDTIQNEMLPLESRSLIRDYMNAIKMQDDPLPTAGTIDPGHGEPGHVHTGPPPAR